MEHTIDNIEKRLDAHGGQIDDIKECLIRLTALQEKMDNEEEDHEQRLRTLEQHGNNMWNSVTQTAVSAVIAGIIAFVLVSLGIGA